VIAVFSKRSRWVILPVTVAGHIAILLTMNIFFINLPQLLIFLPWSAIAARFSRAPRDLTASQPA
jgi:hypothetical protein